MPTISDIDANNLLDVRFSAAASTAPANYYAALVTTAPSDNLGTGLVEVAGGAYARFLTPNDATTWPAAVARVKSNGIPLQWSMATGDWGLVIGIALFDASSAGTFHAYGPLTTPVTVLSGKAPLIQIGNFTITVAA